MMREGTVEQRVKQIISEQFGVHPADVKNEFKIVGDLGANSLDLTELVMEMEEEFEIGITDEAAQKITTVEEAIKAVDGALHPIQGK